jgi:hypothetical protein
MLDRVELEFSGKIWEWRGPAPHHFVTVPQAQSAELADVSANVTYGWGMIPVSGRVGGTAFTTSLWPKDGGYIVPLKAAVRRAEGLEVGAVVTVWLRVGA